MSTRIEKIYVDMDGVIADFEKRYKEKFKIFVFGSFTCSEQKTKKFRQYFTQFIQFVHCS